MRHRLLSSLQLTVIGTCMGGALCRGGCRRESGVTSSALYIPLEVRSVGLPTATAYQRFLAVLLSCTQKVLQPSIQTLFPGSCDQNNTQLRRELMSESQ